MSDMMGMLPITFNNLYTAKYNIVFFFLSMLLDIFITHLYYLYSILYVGSSKKQKNYAKRLWGHVKLC